MKRWIGALACFVGLATTLTVGFYFLTESHNCKEGEQSIVLPNHIHLGGTTYTVRVVPSQEIPGLYGSCDGNAKIIRIRGGLSPRLASTIFIHEVLHAVFHEGKLISRAEGEEAFIRLASPLLFDALFAHPLKVEAPDG